MSIIISDTDNAIVARDKLIDDQRRKIDEYKYKYYNAQDEADKANHDLDYLNEKFEKLLSDYKNLQYKYENLKIDSKEDRKGFDLYAEKVESDMKEKLKENKILKENLDNAKIEIKELKEEIEDKNIEISNMQHSNEGVPKFTSETQTSLQGELAKNVNKFSKEKSSLISKFTSIHSKLNLQINNLTESMKKLQQKPTTPKIRCIYGWKCSRKFCKYSHEHLYSYMKTTSSKCGKTFEAVNKLEDHTENLHEDLSKESTNNLLQRNSVTRKENKDVQCVDNRVEEESCSLSSSFSATLSRTSITSSSSESSFSANNSEREEVGGVS